MAHITLLKDVEQFLRRDLANEKLSNRISSKRNTLLTKVSACIKNEEEQEKIDEFIARQREVSRLQSPENERLKTYSNSQLSDEDDGDQYMDLSDIPNTGGLRVSPPRSCGSGSGYESYASDEDSTLNRTKPTKEENLDLYFSNSGCNIYTYIYLENKNKFLTGKKWVKRVGVVEENHFKCYKKPGDSNAVLDIPLRAYASSLSNKEGTSSVIITLSSGNDGEAHRFYIEREKVDEWTKVLRERSSSISSASNVPPPPVAVRPPSTLPRGTSQPTNAKMATLQRQSSLVLLPDIGKGLKSTMTDMFKKKDKMKKKISTAENLGADVCGNLSIFYGTWVKKWCLVKWNQLFIYGKEEEPEKKVQLSGCDLQPYFDDPERSFAFKLLREGKEIVFMEASSSAEMGKWVGILIAETGCAEMPDHEVESLYMAPEELENVMSTAKQAFISRQETFAKKKGGKDSLQEDEIEEPIYLDLGDDMQIIPQSKLPRNAPPPPPADRKPAKHTKTDSTSSDIVLSHDTESKKRSGSGKKSKKPEDGKKNGGDKKSTNGHHEKTHRREKGKRSSVSEEESKVKSPPPETRTKTRVITVIKEEDKIKDSKTHNSPRERSSSSRDSDTDKKREEIMKKKAEIKNNMQRLNVKKEELTKYVEASTTEREKGKLRITLKQTADEYSKLEKEDMKLEIDLRKLKDGLYSMHSPSNKRPPSRKERRPITTGASGNVLAKAQMWESGKK